MISQLIILTALLICFKFTNGEFGYGFGINFEGFPAEIITVDAFSQEGPSTIQAAINAVPSNNKNWVTIQVKAGVYNEQVKIPRDKPFIYLKGEGIGKSNVVWGEPTLHYPTFESAADNIMVSGITFVNSFNYPPNKNKNAVKQALAAKISGDKSAFYSCSFLGYQDTLEDSVGRHYFRDCTIEGAIDFIFGNGQSIYQNCLISVNIESLQPGLAGFITAQARESENSDGGFVFKECNVVGNGKVLLGRAWKRYSLVIFFDSILSDVVLPIGWSAWNNEGQVGTITFAEAQCRGPGSSQAQRIKWKKNLTSQLLKYYTSISFIDEEGWISKLPQY